MCLDEVATSQARGEGNATPILQQFWVPVVEAILELMIIGSTVLMGFYQGHEPQDGFGYWYFMCLVDVPTYCQLHLRSGGIPVNFAATLGTAKRPTCYNAEIPHTPPLSRIAAPRRQAVQTLL